MLDLRAVIVWRATLTLGALTSRSVEHLGVLDILGSAWLAVVGLHWCFHVLKERLKVAVIMAHSLKPFGY